MARFAVGDIHGCFDELKNLLERIGFEPGRDDLFLTGDLINRGPKSLAAIRWVMDHGSQVRFVLGNHDLHLIASFLGVGKGDSRDTILEILRAPDCPAIVDWLRHAPLAIRERDFFLVHAGLAPSWSLADAEQEARHAESILLSADAPELLLRLPAGAGNFSRDVASARFALARLTRIRACRCDGTMDEKFTGPASQVPEGTRPWFDWPPAHPRELPVVFGHWAALDVVVRPDVIALDSGCVWRRALTAINLDTKEIFQAPCVH